MYMQYHYMNLMLMHMADSAWILIVEHILKVTINEVAS